MKGEKNELYLSEDALSAFDTDFRDWSKYSALILSWTPPDSIDSILDVGGGNGLLMDKLLELFPKANGCVLDYSGTMLERNSLNPRKSTKQGSATNLDNLFLNRKFDLITVNMLLHHLVGNNDESTTANIFSCLMSARRILSPNGLLVIYEQIYDGVIPLFEPGRIIYQLTSIQTPWVAQALKGMGANTAGIGVRFRSRDDWRRLFIESGYNVEAEGLVLADRPSIFRRFSLNIKQVGSYMYALR